MIISLLTTPYSHFFVDFTINSFLSGLHHVFISQWTTPYNHFLIVKPYSLIWSFLIVDCGILSYCHIVIFLSGRHQMGIFFNGLLKINFMKFSMTCTGKFYATCLLYILFDLLIKIFFCWFCLKIQEPGHTQIIRSCACLITVADYTQFRVFNDSCRIHIVPRA